MRTLHRTLVLLAALAVVSLSRCQVPELQPDPQSPDTSRLIQITSADPILVDLICKRVLCGPGPVLDVDLQIKETSSDVLRNNGLSLITLTTGLFVSHSATVDYVLTLETSPALIETGTLSVRDGYQFLLPPYAGLIGTNVGTALNGYRDAQHLKTYCLDESPSDRRQFFDGSKEEICSEYQRFLSVTLQALWPEMQPLLMAVQPDRHLNRLRSGAL